MRSAMLYLVRSAELSVKKFYWVAIAILAAVSLPVVFISCTSVGHISFTNVWLYSGTDYSGTEVEYVGSSPNLGQLDNDVSSIRVKDGHTAILYRDINWQGISEAFTADDPDLSDNVIGNNTASSLEIITN